MDLDAQFKKGFLEAFVLKILTAGPIYGYRLNCEVSKKIKVSESTLYPILRRLESSGLLTTFSEEHAGRLRKYYAITDLGQKRLTEYVAMCDQINELIVLIKEDHYE